MIFFIMCLVFSLFNVTIATRIPYTCNATATCGCSLRQTVFLSKIIGGEPVERPNAWGWMASLRRDEIHQCGASLITPWFVITAAHCVFDIKVLSRLSLNLGIKNLSQTGHVRNVTKIYIHPLYHDDKSFINDLAILRLDKRIDLTDSNIACICLPSISDFNADSPEYPPVNQNLVAIGWGTTDPTVREPTPILRQATIEAIARTDATCLTTIHDDVAQFCAGNPNGEKDTCYGDSGGPLMMFRKGRWELVGITSYGTNCAFIGFSGVYTRIADFKSYIQQIIGKEDDFIREIDSIDDISMPFGGKQLTDDPKSHSNTEIIHSKSMIEIFLICLLTFYIKLFHGDY